MNSRKIPIIALDIFENVTEKYKIMGLMSINQGGTDSFLFFENHSMDFSQGILIGSWYLLVGFVLRIGNLDGFRKVFVLLL